MRVAGYPTGTVVCAMAWVAFALVACAQSAADPSPLATAKPNTDDAAHAVSLPPVRVIVKFNQDVAFQSDQFLHGLQVQTKARLPVRYISSVFSDTHVYSFAPPIGESYARMLQRISAVPEVSFARIDQMVQAH